jgi:hypothetical protein
LLASIASTIAAKPEADHHKKHGKKGEKKWTEEFSLASCNWANSGKNAYFNLQPGFQQVFEGKEENESVRLEITVLDETKTVDGVTTRVVEERETVNGQLVELSRNFFALCGPSGDAFYFGEEVDIYRAGALAGHEGAWMAGTAGAKAGLFLPSRPLLGARFYQEVAPGVAMDRVTVVALNDSLETPGGAFRNCLRTEETTPLEPDALEYKVFAPGVGLIQDGGLLLVKQGFLTASHR